MLEIVPISLKEANAFVATNPAKASDAQNILNNHYHNLSQIITNYDK